ncbi:MAG: GWxTD domain-containing protein [Candidatus Aminicenantes bacterium]|jgi:GWxTD domain-containing protein|nr:GWxTD domain-containing protein [Candidatus Aminicenantes bacterium]
MRKSIILISSFLFFLFWFTACTLTKLEKNLKPQDAEWLSEVRYIITPEERKIFLELPDSEREQFKEDFWKRRDPDPDTEENEFKEEYYRRIKQANQLFQGEGRPGWLTDRGRIYILFGPPTERETYPMEAAGFCREVWYYGSFPVIFIDEHCSGNYVLSAINLEHLQDLNMAQNLFEHTITDERSLFDYNLRVLHKERTAEKLSITLSFSMEYKEIWFEVKDNASMETELYLTLELKDKSGKIIWEGNKTISLSFKDEDEFNKVKGKKFMMELEIKLPEGKYTLPPAGKYFLYSSVKQKTGEKELKKVMAIDL